MIGHDSYQVEQLGRDQYKRYRLDAEAYRAIEYGAYHSATGKVFRWLGDLLLRWGRRLREHNGDVEVRISTVSRGTHDPRHAA